jgi:predicted enzyme related to lactoylglutathione lyase
MKHALSWFEIPCQNLPQAQAFYEAVLACTLRPEPMGPSQGAVFPYDGEDAVGGCLMAGPTAPQPANGGTLVYLDCSPSLDAALARVAPAGGRIALPRQALPEGMGFFAHIWDPDGNRIGLHALA